MIGRRDATVLVQNTLSTRLLSMMEKISSARRLLGNRLKTASARLRSTLVVTFVTIDRDHDIPAAQPASAANRQTSSMVGAN